MTFDAFTTAVPAALAAAAKGAETDLLPIAQEAAEAARAGVPVRTGALRASIRAAALPGGAEVGTEDPAAAALAAAGRADAPGALMLPVLRAGARRLAARLGRAVRGQR